MYTSTELVRQRLFLFRLEQRIKKVLHTEPSSQPLLERDIRVVHRCVFLDHAAKLGEGEYGFWLTQILKQWPITFQARLLYLLTAPENEDGMHVTHRQMLF